MFHLQKKTEGFASAVSGVARSTLNRVLPASTARWGGKRAAGRLLTPPSRGVRSLGRQCSLCLSPKVDQFALSPYPTLTQTYRLLGDRLSDHCLPSDLSPRLGGVRRRPAARFPPQRAVLAGRTRFRVLRATPEAPDRFASFFVPKSNVGGNQI